MSSFKSKTIFSYAKINIGLKILNRLPTGYHQICTNMQEIEFYDEISIFQTKERGEITLNVSGPVEIPSDESNLCIKSAKLIFQLFNIKNGIEINLKKNIPIGSGLGGGSSNAASVIILLNELYNLGLNDFELINISEKLGSDVPFFIKGGLQRCSGKGEITHPISNKISGYLFLLVFPPFNISTKWAYGAFKKYLVQSEDSAKFSNFNKPINWLLFENDFEKVIKSTYPEISDIKHTLIENGALFASLSGSGSTMFGIFDNALKVQSTLTSFAKYSTLIVKPIYRR